MEVFFVGTKRNGAQAFKTRAMSLSDDELHFTLRDLHMKHKEAIHVAVHIAYPDPEVVAIKRRLADLMVMGRKEGKTADEIADVMFSEFLIKNHGG